MSLPSSPSPEARPTLPGQHVRLEPLSPSHASALHAVVQEDPDLYAWNVVPRDRATMESYIADALSGFSQGHMLPFAIVRRAHGSHDERVVGCTRFFNIERWTWPPGHAEHGRAAPDVCEIGYTWLARSVLRTPVNTEAKLLLLTHAFDAWKTHRVTLRTDVRNARSRAAIERLGAKLDGCLRAERPGADGTVRDSAVYSIIASEWPVVRARLQGLASRPWA